MKIFFMLLFSLFASSCSGRLGYYVALWPPEGLDTKSGDIVSVISQSDIRNVYVIEHREERKREEVPRTSGKFFKKRKDAESFREKYKPYINTYGYSEKSLNIRTSPDVSAGREYRLRPSQIVKIIEKLPEPVTVDRLTGYWYLVLTDDGFEGYCFDKYLSVYELDSGKSGPEKEKDYLESFFTHTWYPTSYLEALKNRQVVISRLRTGEGVFPDREKKRIVIQTGQERIEFTFENAVTSGGNSVILSGTPVEIMFYSADRIFLRYSYRGTDYSAFYTLLENPVDYYIGLEIERRNAEIENFIKRGRYLASDLYGSITFQEKGRFVWTGYINLVPEIIPFGYGNSGYIKNDYFLSEELSGRFDGVFSFVFERNGNEIIFAWLNRDGGVELTHIPEESVTDNIVNFLPDEQHVYYFRQSGLLEEE